MFLLLLLLSSVVVGGAAIVDDGESDRAEEAEPHGGLHQLVVLAPPGLGPALQLVGQVVLGATVTCFVHNIAPVWDSN